MDIAALATALAAGHPDTGAFDADAETATGQLNAVNRDAAAAAETIRNYFLLERKNAMALMGRLEIIADSAEDDVDPLGDLVTMTNVHITAAKTMLRIIDPGSEFSLDFNDSRFGSLLDDLAGGSGAKAINPADKTAILAFSTNKQSRATEIGLGLVRVGHVQIARA